MTGSAKSTESTETVCAVPYRLRPGRRLELRQRVALTRPAYTRRLAVVDGCRGGVMSVLKSRVRFVLKLFLASIFLAANGCTLTNESDGKGNIFDDGVVTARIKEAILKDPALKYSRINVETSNGIVQLSGIVNSGEHKANAVVVVCGVDGVKYVKKDMLLK
jgi:BON domain